MPHVNHSAISPVDEIKVYQDEGESEEEQKSSAENLKEVKSDLVTEEEEKTTVQIPHASYLSPKNGPSERPPDHRSSLPPPGRRYDYLSPSPFGYVVSSYPHPNAALSMVNRVPLVPSNHAPLSFMQVYNSDFQPPPAHIGISPVHVDPKTGIRTPVYPLHPPSQFHPPVFSPEFTHQFPWPHHSMYSLSPGFRSPPYPPPFSPANHLPSKFPSPSSPHSVILPPLNHPPFVGPKMETLNSDSRQFHNHSHNNHHQDNSVTSLPQHNQNSSSQAERSPSERARSEKKKSHIKKPLNAFMLYMKEQRAQVVAECTLKESAAINQLLGKKWHNLTREEQSKYYELAKKERQIHMQMYPGWTARDNYAINAKRKKRKRDKSQEGDANNPKKCRARFGLDRQSSWCKPCRRKKKCIRYISGSDNTGESEDNIGSVESLGSVEVPTPDSRFDGENNLSDSDSGNGDGDEDDELEVSSEFSLSSPPVPKLLRDSVQSMEPLGSPSPQTLNVQHFPRPPAGCLASPDTPPSTDSSTAPLPAAVT